MIEFLIFFGGTMVLGAISMTDDALSTRKHKQFLRLFNEQVPDQTLTGFLISLLATKPKDWAFDNSLTLKNPFHSDVEVFYQEGREKKEECVLHISFKKKRVLVYRLSPGESSIKVRSAHPSFPSLTTQDTVKMERVFTHLHEIHEEFIARNKEEKQRQKERAQEKTARNDARLKEEVLRFLATEQKVNPTRNPHFHAFSWNVEADTASITWTFYLHQDAQYICFYDKVNKTYHSKVVTTDKTNAFTALQPHLDAWCFRQTENRGR